LGFKAYDAIQYMGDALDKRLHDEMIELFPTYETRYKSSGQSADLHDVGLSDSFVNTIKGGTSLSDAFSQGPLKAIEIFAQTGMAGIKEADGMVIRSLYLAAKDKAGFEGAFKDLTPEQLFELDSTVSKVINETQPSYHPLTRSAAQSSDSLMLRQFSMFSSQPLKNFNNILRKTQELEGLKVGSHEYKKAVKELKTSINIVAMQTALVAGAGTATLTLKDEALDLLRSEEDIEAKEKFYGEMGRAATRFWQQNLATAFGNIPISGQLLATMLSHAITGEGFDVNVLPLELFNDTNEFLGDIRTSEDLEDVAKTLGNGIKLLGPIAGLPNIATQTGEAAISGLTE